jgi:hypothetical protein
MSGWARAGKAQGGPGDWPLRRGSFSFNSAWIATILIVLQPFALQWRTTMTRLGYLALAFLVTACAAITLATVIAQAAPNVGLP